MTKKAIIVGASGLIGSNLLAMLSTQPNYGEILIIARKKTRTNNIKVTQLIIEFAHLERYAKSITGSVIFCCLGSTRNETPDLDEYRKIDHDYPVKLAEIALKNGIEQYHLVSSIGADAGSSNFYLRMKGETEEDINKIGLKSLHIYQPSVLMGYRQSARRLEDIIIFFMKITSPLLLGRLKKYRAISANSVAKTIFKQSLKNQTGVFTYTSDKIKQLSK
ncbi:NAD-dependent epimerase/dehydratase family protein [Mucilaginibacter sp.]|uniref:NAD-dependent epimerase/dehydratase family protein n=1 Tax=Mucilaginibacter sp. TaxID=1882438 RepID=UPI00261E1E8A|nr:NAD-dependent epimerase/dehydratase family protein [Mucilaginibacter sp.]MDB4924410.1 NAD-dependent epimerase/dehydratase family protein [Mucilaginibacter sp.]